LLNRFFAANRRICDRIEDRLPRAFTQHLHTSYKYLVAARVNAMQRLVVIDIGGGKECPYLPFLSAPEDHTIIATDISETELRQNLRCTRKVVADAAHLPFADASIDLVTSRSVIEHLRDNAAFFRSCHSVLRPGGYVVHTFPCRFSPFSILNKLLRVRAARALLYYFQPHWQDECGFKVHYDHCSYSEILFLLEENGYELVHCELCYYQAIYYTFFVPLYLVMLGYDLLAYASGIKDLSCAMLLVARKRPDRGEVSF
jgi:SAM-dependent methyltransferase